MDRAPGGREVDAPLSLRDSVGHLLACGLSLNGCAGGQEPSASCVLEDQVCSPGLSITTTQALHGSPVSPPHHPAVPGAWKTGGVVGEACAASPVIPLGLGLPRRSPSKFQMLVCWCGVRVTWGPCSCL